MFVVGDVVADIVADVGAVVVVVADAGSGVCAVVVMLSKSCCTFEMFALRAEEISVTGDFTIVMNKIGRNGAKR